MTCDSGQDPLTPTVKASKIVRSLGRAEEFIHVIVMPYDIWIDDVTAAYSMLSIDRARFLILKFSVLLFCGCDQTPCLLSISTFQSLSQALLLSSFLSFRFSLYALTSALLSFFPALSAFRLLPS